LARLVQRESIAGDFVECGVYKGGSAAVLAHALRRGEGDARLWLFDSFQGLPTPTMADGPSAPALAGEVVGDRACVEDRLRRTGVPLDRIRIVEGWFHDTFEAVPIDRIALLHIDADWHKSVKLCLETFYDRLSPAAVVVLDDYEDWPGCRAALEEFAAQRGLQFTVTGGGSVPHHFRKPV
jgi:O-methyltransferase